MSADFNRGDIQGNILRGYRRNLVRYLLLEITDRAAARRFLGVAVEGGNADVPGITSETQKKWTVKPNVCFNVGLTYDGLRALGTPGESLAMFPTEFIEGPARRAVKLGDFGTSAPAHWPTPFDQPARLHVIVSLYADVAEHLDRAQAQVVRAFHLLGVRDGRDLPRDKVFFGYRDGIAQPRFAGFTNDDFDAKHDPIDPLGTVLLGHPTRFEGLRFKVPSPIELGHNGTFNAFRVLAQDAAGFEAYLDRAAQELLDRLPDLTVLLAPGDEQRISHGMGRDLTRFEVLREIVAAQMCGRWRDDLGTPVMLLPEVRLVPDAPHELPAYVNHFGYDAASGCPAGAHIRRTNPRGGQIVQRIANHTRRIVRRGMPYGPDFDPAHPDTHERGLLGNFIGANIGAQFEAIMCDWMNLALHDPTITGSNDPLTGANVAETSFFDLTLKNGGTFRLRGFPRFVTTRGGAYTFLPSLPAIRYLAALPG